MHACHARVLSEWQSCKIGLVCGMIHSAAANLLVVAFVLQACSLGLVAMTQTVASGIELMMYFAGRSTTQEWVVETLYLLHQWCTQTRRFSLHDRVPTSLMAHRVNIFETPIVVEPVSAHAVSHRTMVG